MTLLDLFCLTVFGLMVAEVVIWAIRLWRWFG